MVKMGKNRFERHLESRAVVKPKAAEAARSTSEQSESPGADPQCFGMRFLELIGEVTGTRGWTYDSEKFQLSSANEEVIELSSIFVTYCAKPRSERESFLTTTARNLRWIVPAIPDRFEDLAPRLFPSLYPRMRAEAMRLHDAMCGLAPWDASETILSEHMAIEFVCDLAGHFNAITADDVRRFGFDVSDALEAAKDNLRKAGASGFRMEQQGVYVSTAEDYRSTASMLLPDVIQRLPVRGDPIAFAHVRTRLIVVGSEDEESLTSIAKSYLSQRVHHEFLGDVVYRLDGIRWTPWLPSEGHPAYCPLKRLKDTTLELSYFFLNPHLEDAIVSRGERRHVARFCTRFDSSARPISFATVAAGVDTILPKVDEIRFVAVHERVGVLEQLAVNKWKRVQEIAGDVFEPFEAYPPRYRIRRFPTATQLKEIGIVLD